MQIKRMSLAAVFYLLIPALIVFAGLQVLLQFRSNRGEQREAVNRWTITANSLTAITGNTAAIQSSVTRMLLNNSTEDVHDELQNIDNAGAEIQNELARLRKFLPAAADSIAQQYYFFSQHADSIISLNKPDAADNAAAIAHFYSFFLPSYNALNEKSRTARQLAQQEAVQVQSRALARGKRDSVVTLFTLAGALVAALAGTFLLRQYDRRIKRRKQRIAREKEEEQQHLHRLGYRAQEEDRNLVGKELHDNVNQLLAMVQLNLSMLQQTPERLHELAPRCSRYINDAIEEIRTLSRSLVNPVSRNISLRDAVQELVDSLKDVSPSTEFNLFMDDSDEERYVDPEIKLNTYRIIQEQLNNIFKHSGASVVNIYLTVENGEVRLIVEDNGKGFDESVVVKGIGVTNIHNRALAYDGMATFETSPGNGCILTVSFPVQ